MLRHAQGILASVSVTLIAACADAPTASVPLTSAALVPLASASAAVVVHTHSDVLGPFSATNPCNGEDVTFAGSLSDDLQIVINGNRINLSEHIEGRLTAVGSLGNTYQSVVNETAVVNESLTNGEFVIEDITPINLVSDGSAPNFRYLRKAHLSITPAGVVTVDYVTEETQCRG